MLEQAQRLIAQWRAKAAKHDATAHFRDEPYDDIAHMHRVEAKRIRACADDLAALLSALPTAGWQDISTLPPRGYFADGIDALVSDAKNVFIARRCGVLPDGEVSGVIPSYHGNMTEWGIRWWHPVPTLPAPQAALQTAPPETPAETASREEREL